MIQKWITYLSEIDLGSRGQHKLIVLAVVFPLFAYFYMIGDSNRFSWIHILSSYLIGFAVLFLGQKSLAKINTKNVMAALFPKDIWIHPSTINDCMLAALNSVLARSFEIIFKLVPMVIFGVAGYKLAHLFPITPYTQDPTFYTMLIVTLALALAGDFSYYWAHRWVHRVSPLWEFHKVHHSAEVMTPITLLRAHPLDNFIVAFCRKAGEGFIIGVFLFLYPTTNGTITILSANVIVFSFQLIGSHLRHSHIWWSWGRTLEHIFISPAMHHVHHSDQPKHFNKNYGGIFAIWDWMFGSLYIPVGKEEIVFGIGKDKETENYDTITKLYFRPFYSAYKILVKK